MCKCEDIHAIPVLVITGKSEKNKQRPTMLCVAVVLNHWQGNSELTGMVCDLKLKNVVLNGLFDCKCQYLNFVMAAACYTSRDSRF